MIVLDLTCSQGHRFEGWFASREAFDAQCADGHVQCAVCQSPEVSALPSGPLVRRHGERSPASETSPASVESREASAVMSATPDAAAELYRAMARMARAAEDVGERFPDEARRIHYREAPARTIRGVANRDETRELLEEGILVLPALVPKPSETH